MTILLQCLSRKSGVEKDKVDTLYRTIVACTQQ